MFSSKFWRRALLGVGLLAPVAFLQPTVAQPDPVALRPKVPINNDPKIPFEKYTLSNGLEVILVQDNSVPVVAVNVWYHVGSGHEVVGRSGFAHLFEHMMFQGSVHTGKDAHFSTLKQIGAEGVNGTTNQDRTNYFEIVPSNELETGLWLESDRMGFMLPMLDKAALDNQIEVVKNERRQNYETVAYRLSLFALYEAMYPEGHPYRYLTIGLQKDLNAATVDDVKNFFKTWYVPSNATLTLVGDFDTANAKQLVEKWFGSFPKSTKPSTITIPAPAPKAATVTVSDPLAKLEQVSFAWHTPANFQPGDAELDITANALTAEGFGRLWRALVETKKVQYVDASQSSGGFSSIFEVQVRLLPGTTVEEVSKIVMAELSRLAKDPLDQKDINQVVTQVEAMTVRGLESVMGRAQTLQSYNHYLGDPDKITFNLDRYRTTTPEKIRAVVAKYLVPSEVVTIITKPAAAPTGGK